MPFAVAIDDEGGQVLVVVDLGKDNHHVGKSAVGDPHLLAVDDVMFAVFGQLGRGLAAVGVRSAAGLGQAVAALELARGHARDVLLFLCVVAIVQDGQGADAGVGREAHAKSVPIADGFGNEHGGLEVHAHAAEFFGDGASEQTEFPGFLHEFFNQARFLLVDGFDVGMDALFNEVVRHLLDHPLLLVPLFGNEDVVRSGFPDQEFASSDGLSGLFGIL